VNADEGRDPAELRQRIGAAFAARPDLPPVAAIAAARPRQPLGAATPEGLDFVAKHVGPCIRRLDAFRSQVLSLPMAPPLAPSDWPDLVALLRALIEAGDRIAPAFVEPPEPVDVDDTGGAGRRDLGPGTEGRR
jgi:hypothetical protein